MPYKFTLILLVFNSIYLFAQPRLEIVPDEIEYEDIFHRNKTVMLINEGNASLRIDSLVYKNSSYYFLRFDRPWEYPVTLQPNDTVKMDCILESYIYLPFSQTSDTLLVYNNGVVPVEKLKIKIDYYDDNYGKGIFRGRVTSSGNPIEAAKIHFLYDNNYIIKTVSTDIIGFYNAELPPGKYAIAVESDSHYVSFHQNEYDPYNSDLITLKKDSTKVIDFEIERVLNTGNSISGVITDSISLARVKKGVIIVRSGTHTPNRIYGDGKENMLPDKIYTAFVKSDGSFVVRNIIAPDYYYVQAFSDYYLPSYYNLVNKPAVFWQQADSIFVNGSLSNVNIVMPRDSSVGGGKINGSVTINSETEPIADLLVFAKSLDNNLWYNFTFLKDSNSFQMTNLPYGNYKLFTQKIGVNEGTSSDLSITPITQIINGVNIPIIISSVNDEELISDGFQLFQNYPNPFNPATSIKFRIMEKEIVRLSVFNMLGEEIKILLNGEREAGYHTINFDGSELTSGVYFYQIQIGNFMRTNKMILLK